MRTQSIIILGGAGDLSRRLLIPGIGDYLHQYAVLNSANRPNIIGVGLHEEANFPDIVREALTHTVPDDQATDTIVASTSFTTADATNPEDLRTLIEQARDTQILFYFALAPSVTAASVEALSTLDIPDDTIFALEKPFGTNTDEADELDRLLLSFVTEDRIIRIDHFLSESAVINLAGIVRTTAPIQATWNSTWIESITVLYDETLALEGRAEFYDGTGAAEDMLQSHLLQSLAQVLAAAGNCSSSSILEAMRYVEGSGRRARYTAGDIAGTRIPSYVDEDGVDPARGTETLAQFAVEVDTEQWRGTRFILRSGKAIGDPRQEIRVTYRHLDTNPDPDALPARFVIPFDDALEFDVPVPDHGRAGETKNVTMRAAADTSELTPYGRVARGVLNNDHSVGVKPGTPQQAWAIIQPLLDAFESAKIPLEEYPAGSQGPEGWGEPGR